MAKVVNPGSLPAPKVFINAQPMSLLLWQVSSIAGISLIATGVGAGYVDVASHFEFELLSNHLGIFLIAALPGTFFHWPDRLGKTL
jgi:hypothetical protein